MMELSFGHLHHLDPDVDVVAPRLGVVLVGAMQARDRR
jgi:hypothetical protein